MKRIQNKLEKLQSEFYELLYEICKSQQFGGGVSNISLLYKDLCDLKAQIDDILEQVKKKAKK